MRSQFLSAVSCSRGLSTSGPPLNISILDVLRMALWHSAERPFEFRLRPADPLLVKLKPCPNFLSSLTLNHPSISFLFPTLGPFQKESNSICRSVASWILRSKDFNSDNHLSVWPPVACPFLTTYLEKFSFFLIKRQPQVHCESPAFLEARGSQRAGPHRSFVRNGRTRGQEAGQDQQLTVFA